METLVFFCCFLSSYRRVPVTSRPFGGAAHLRHAPQSARVRRAGWVPAGTLPAGEQRRPPPVRLRAVQRRPAQLHRPKVRHDRSENRPLDPTPALPLHGSGRNYCSPSAVQRGRPQAHRRRARRRSPTNHRMNGSRGTRSVFVLFFFGVFFENALFWEIIYVWRIEIKVVRLFLRWDSLDLLALIDIMPRSSPDFRDRSCEQRQSGYRCIGLFFLTTAEMYIADRGRPHSSEKRGKKTRESRWNRSVTEMTKSRRLRRL